MKVWQCWSRAKAGVLLCLAVCGTLPGCGRSREVVAVFPRTTGTLLWENFHVGVAEQAAGQPYTLYWNAPSDPADTGAQLDLVADYARKRYHGILFAPIDTMASRSVILEANQDHVPLVVVDDEESLQPNRYLSYVSTDERMGGRLAAAEVARVLGGHGRIAITGISGRLASAHTREEAFESALSSLAPHIEIAIRHFGDGNTTHEQQTAQEIFSSKVHVDALVAMNAPATRGAFYAEIAAQPSMRAPVRVPIIGFDQDMLVPIQTGGLDAVVAQDMQALGRQAMLNLQAEMQGRPVQGFTTVPPVLITRKNLFSPELARLWRVESPAWGQQ